MTKAESNEALSKECWDLSWAGGEKEKRVGTWWQDAWLYTWHCPLVRAIPSIKTSYQALPSPLWSSRATASRWQRDMMRISSVKWTVGLPESSLSPSCKSCEVGSWMSICWS